MSEDTGLRDPTAFGFRNRYCGSKFPHETHTWKMIGRPEGPTFRCKGKPSRTEGAP